MHFEVLVEDESGKIVLESILRKILGSAHSFRIHGYKGAGRLPKKRLGTTVPSKRILLDRLPALLRGYGRSQGGFPQAVVIVVDLDDRDCRQFKEELEATLADCNPRPRALIRIAIEEIEAWLLGDRQAVEAAYPRARTGALDGYLQDSICGTWEKLADAVYPGGSVELTRLGFPHTGVAKCEWAEKIAPHLSVDSNRSKSFQVFRDGIRELAGEALSTRDSP